MALGIGLASIGVPAPGETLLLIAAAAAATGSGSIFWVIAAAAAGAIIGDNIAFRLGRRYGRAIMIRLPFIDEQKLAHSEAFFNRHGPKTVVIARFIPIVRSVVSYIAGINQMPSRLFTGYNLTGGILWASIIGTLGFVFGKNLSLVEQALRRAGGIWAAVLLLAIFLIWVNQRWHQSERHFEIGRIGTIYVWWLTIQRRIARQGGRGLLWYGLLLVVSGWVTGIMLDDWVDREPELYQRDRLVADWLRLGADEVPLGVEALVWLGDVRSLAAIALLTAGWQWWHGRRRRGWLTLFNFSGALLLGWGLQIWLKRPLPPSLEPAWRLTEYTFPHLSSLLSVAVFGWLAVMWLKRRPWASRVNGATAAAFLPLSIGVTGPYMRQANLSDVLAGLSLGFLWLAIPLALADERIAQVGRSAKVKAGEMMPRQRLNFLLALTIPVLMLTLVQPLLAQDPSYHNFADQRPFLGIPNFLNVTSNAPFLIFGLMGLLFLRRPVEPASPVGIGTD